MLHDRQSLPPRVLRHGNLEKARSEKKAVTTSPYPSARRHATSFPPMSQERCAPADASDAANAKAPRAPHVEIGPVAGRWTVMWWPRAAHRAREAATVCATLRAAQQPREHRPAQPRRAQDTSPSPRHSASVPRQRTHLWFCCSSLASLGNKMGTLFQVEMSACGKVTVNSFRSL